MALALVVDLGELNPFSIIELVISGRNLLLIDSSQHSKKAITQERAASWATTLASIGHFLIDSK